MGRKTGRYHAPEEGCVNGHAFSSWHQMPSGRWVCKECRAAQAKYHRKHVEATRYEEYRAQQNTYNRAYRARQKAKKESDGRSQDQTG